MKYLQTFALENSYYGIIAHGYSIYHRASDNTIYRFSCLKENSRFNGLYKKVKEGGKAVLIRKFDLLPVDQAFFIMLCDAILD